MKRPATTTTYTPKPIPKSYYVKRALIALLIVGAVIVASACSKSDVLEHRIDQYGAPEAATNLAILDEHWYTFEWKDQCFLAMNGPRRTAVTKIDCEVN